MSNSAKMPSFKRHFSVVVKADNSTDDGSETTTVSPPPPADGSTSSSGDEGSDSGSNASPPNNTNNNGNNNKNSNKTSNTSPPPPPGSNSGNNQGSAVAPDNSETPPASPPPPPPSSSSSKSPPAKSSPPPQKSGSNSPTPSPPLPTSNSGNQSPPPSTSQKYPQTSEKSPPPQSKDKPSPVTPSNDDSPPAPRTQTTAPSPLNSAGFHPPPTIESPSGQYGSENGPSTHGNMRSSSSTQAGSLDSSSNSKAVENSGNTGYGHEHGNSATTAIIVASTVVVSVILIALIAVIIVTRKKNKRHHGPPYAPPYMTPPNNFSSMQQSDPYYYGQGGAPHSMGYSSQNNSYGSQQHSGASGNGGSQRGMSSGPDSGLIGGGKSFFSYEDVMEMTRGFARENIIGEGGFGCVFKGWQPDGKMVAVKQLKAGSGQGDREFKAEVEIISRVHHRHLVSLVGYSMSDTQRLLIYEFLPNNTLEYHLHAKGPGLDWSQRLKIAIGAAKGLAYLHEDCNPKIIHRDIKSANILLGSDFEAQVADFGLARLNDTTQTHVSTRVMGTFGYLAPEYAQSGKLTDRSDVYSFGVVLLELITGRKPVDSTLPLGDESLVEWARPHLMHTIETRDLGELVDPRLEKRYVEAEMLRMIETAAACIRHSAPKRPRMVQVVRALDNEEIGDLTNGMKYGQSTIYNSGQYNEEIMKFRRMALGSDDSGEFGYSTGDFSTRDMSYGAHTTNSTGEYSSSGELETRAINRPSSRNW
ncbi:unnamed protein product [Linum trigynum]|uniref:non-specific serine/threonine protein kinase n=2 Tax=Linum trigynum TaxID=586398 RepID=A0AAV2EBU4_9ROSI